MKSYLKTENLAVGYHGKPLIEEVSLCVQRGKIVTLIGPNGSGKSTILKTIIGQLPELSGTVFLVLLEGVLTGVGGGVLRDVCCMERPYIFTKHVYACASLAGAAVCMALWSMGESFAMLMGCGVTLALRICAAVFRWSLPKA